MLLSGTVPPRRGTHGEVSTSASEPTLKDRILIRNARQHNLKGIDVELPRRALVVLTGPSGSGKSSLAFDTLYAEGQRRYAESLSTYAQQFLERMEKPLVDAVEGISPAVAIEQKNPIKTSRSTVGTATEVYDYLRLLWARAGTTHCPVCDREVRPDTVQSATDRLLELPDGSRVVVAFPLPKSGRIKHAGIVENLRAMGFVRVLADGVMLDVAEPGAEDAASLGTDLAAVRDLLVVVDRLAIRHGDANAAGDPGTADASARERLADSVGTAFVQGEGEVAAVLPDSGERLLFSERFRCPDHPAVKFLDPTPRLFSFNNPYGSCPECTGFGATLEYDEALIVPNPSRSLREGAVDPWEKPRYHKYRERLLGFAKTQDVSIDTPWEKLPADFRAVVIRGKRKLFQGMIPFLKSREEKRYKQYIRVFLRQYQSAQPCGVCRGTKLRPEALYVRLGGLDIAAASALQITELRPFVEGLELPRQAAAIAQPIVREIVSRLRFLDDVGLGYLSLHRQTRTLSGGEAQRIALANSLGASLVDTLYVLDEPTIGLHPRDTDRLLGLLRKLRAAGNSVVVVEHDSAAIRAADHVVELGPGSGERGGTIVFQGTPDELLATDTVTGRYLAGTDGPPPTSRRRPTHGPGIHLHGARLHNVRGIDVDLPLGTLTLVTGVSGSGKSTLVHDILYRGLERELSGGETSAQKHLGEEVGAYERLEGAGTLDAVVLIDQSPIGRSPRSNPVTYIKAFDHVRELFAKQPTAKQHRWGAGHFSFNVKGGRCEHCQGAGAIEVEMVFMADVFVPCEACGGKRYRPETLEVKFKGLNIHEVLNLTVDEAIRFFIREDRLGQMLWQLQQVGLGYLRLGQPATTLSGGEAQRVKLARELARRATGRTLYILDEPTTGLHFDDVKKLLKVLHALVERGNTVIVIEHNLDVVKTADWVIDLGPEGGFRGGEVVAEGTPEAIAGNRRSATGRFLGPLLRRGA